MRSSETELLPALAGRRILRIAVVLAVGGAALFPIDAVATKLLVTPGDRALGGQTVVYGRGATAVRCSLGLTATRMPRVSCSVRRAGGTPRKAGFAASLDARRLTVYRIGRRRPTPLASRAEPRGSALFGPFARDPRRATIRLRRAETIGFAGTGIACSTIGGGSSATLGCFLRSN